MGKRPYREPFKLAVEQRTRRHIWANRVIAAAIVFPLVMEIFVPGWVTSTVENLWLVVVGLALGHWISPRLRAGQ